jgi:hypothetical protein
MSTFSRILGFLGFIAVGIALSSAGEMIFLAGLDIPFDSSPQELFIVLFIFPNCCTHGNVCNRMAL